MTRGMCLFVILGIYLSSFILAQEGVETTPEPPLADTIRAVFSADDLSPLLGVPIELTLTVEMPVGAHLIEFPEFPEDWLPFMVREVGVLSTQTLSDGREIFTQTLTVILWDVGDFETPETFIGYQLDGEQEVYYVPVRSVPFTVPSVLNPDMNQNELRPLKPQIGLFYVPWWVIVSVVGLLVGSIWGGMRWYRYRRDQRVIEVVQPLDSAVISHDVISRLRMDENAPLYVYERVNAQLRWYAGQRLGLTMEHMTALELSDAVGAKLEPEIGQELARILIFIEQLRFSDEVASEKSLQGVVARSLAWIDMVEASLEALPHKVTA